jgi:hypothetical protein
MAPHELCSLLTHWDPTSHPPTHPTPPHPLQVIASFEDDKGLYNQADAGGFIKLQALRLRTLGVNRHKMGI